MSINARLLSQARQKLAGGRNQLLTVKVAMEDLETWLNEFGELLADVAETAAIDEEAKAEEAAGGGASPVLPADLEVLDAAGQAARDPALVEEGQQTRAIEAAKRTAGGDAAPAVVADCAAFEAAQREAETDGRPADSSKSGVAANQDQGTPAGPTPTDPWPTPADEGVTDAPR